MKKIDVLGKSNSIVILDLNDYTVSNVLVRVDMSIIDAIKIAKETIEAYLKDVENDYDGILNYEIIGINKGHKYLIVDKSENKEHIFRDDESDDTDGISELLWIVDINVEEIWEDKE